MAQAISDLTNAFDRVIRRSRMRTQKSLSHGSPLNSLAGDAFIHFMATSHLCALWRGRHLP